MGKTVDEKLSDLMEAVKALPDATQEALVEEFPTGCPISPTRRFQMSSASR